MKKVKGFWVDENENRWDCKKYSLDKAIELSKSLIKCYNCNNCENCQYCHSCFDCISCLLS